MNSPSPALAGQERQITYGGLEPQAELVSSKRVMGV